MGSDLQFVDRAGWVSSPVLRNKLLRRERREAFGVFLNLICYSIKKNGNSVVVGFVLSSEVKN